MIDPVEIPIGAGTLLGQDWIKGNMVDLRIRFPIDFIRVVPGNNQPYMVRRVDFDIKVRMLVSGDYDLQWDIFNVTQTKLAINDQIIQYLGFHVVKINIDYHPARPVNGFYRNICVSLTKEQFRIVTLKEFI